MHIANSALTREKCTICTFSMLTVYVLQKHSCTCRVKKMWLRQLCANLYILIIASDIFILDEVFALAGKIVQQGKL